MNPAAVTPEALAATIEEAVAIVQQAAAKLTTLAQATVERPGSGTPASEPAVATGPALESVAVASRSLHRAVVLLTALEHEAEGKGDGPGSLLRRALRDVREAQQLLDDVVNAADMPAGRG